MGATAIVADVVLAAGLVAGFAVIVAMRRDRRMAIRELARVRMMERDTVELTDLARLGVRYTTAVSQQLYEFDERLTKRLDALDASVAQAITTARTVGFAEGLDEQITTQPDGGDVLPFRRDHG